jgi:hypothetical protein
MPTLMLAERIADLMLEEQRIKAEASQGKQAPN